MSTVKDFLEGCLAAFYQFDGLIFVLHAFFDETGGDEQNELTAVAGFVYDKEGLTAFTEAWEPQTRTLRGHYRSSACNGGHHPFGPPDWPHLSRERLMNKLSDLVIEHALAGFVVSTGKEDFEAAFENGPGIKKFASSPYALCAGSILSMVTSWASNDEPARKVHCWFESGGAGEREAQELAARLIGEPETQPAFSAIERRSWIPKEEAPALCSADLLAWEWRRNALVSQDAWTPRMRHMIEGMHDRSKPILPHHITGVGDHVKARISDLFSRGAGDRFPVARRRALA